MADEKHVSLLKLSSSPHIGSRDSIISIMWMVVIALLPAAAFSVYIFGLNALLVMVVSIVAAVASEALFQLLMKKPVTAHDGSAVITGLLVAMNVPPMAPLWMAGIGSFFAIIIVKQLFGGLGFNIFNPALAARAFMMASWPVHMTTKWHKFAGVNVLSDSVRNTTGLSQQTFDSITQATPLTLLREGPKMLAEHGIAFDKLRDILVSPEMLKSMVVGNIGGCIGETSAALLLAGAVFLLIKRIISWHIPVSYIGTVAVMAAIYYAVAGYPVELMVLMHIASGGLFLGAFFMATDMVTSPVSAKGMILFGAGCGLITFIIRIWGGYPEGVSYSILLMNAAVPLIDRYTKPKVFGLTGESK